MAEDVQKTPFVKQLAANGNPSTLDQRSSRAAQCIGLRLAQLLFISFSAVCNSHFHRSQRLDKVRLHIRPGLLLRLAQLSFSTCVFLQSTRYQ